MTAKYPFRDYIATIERPDEVPNCILPPHHAFRGRLFLTPNRALSLFSLISTLLLGWTCFAQSTTTACYIPPAFQEYFKKPTPPGSGTDAFQGLGMAYLQFGCTNEARASFQQELREAPSRQAHERSALTETVDILLSYTSGLEAYHKGDFAFAFKIFSAASQPNNPAFIQAAATTSYADLMMRHFDANRWEDLRGILIRRERDGDWKARFYLTFCGLDASNAIVRTEDLRNILATDLPTEARLADEIILAGLFAGSNRLLEADLLTKDIEVEVGTKALASDLRLYYLQLCLGIASRLAGAGNAEAASRVLMYQKALEDYNAPD